MVGRDQDETHRAATPLELLFDLVFVISFGVAGSEFAHFLAEGYYADGLIGFGFSMFAVVWAWINFTWFASAYDTDDWLYRLLVMVMMVGVVVLALGIPAMFASVHAGGDFDGRAMILGYVVMRVPMIAMWARAGRDHPERRRTAQTYVRALVVAQVLWTISAFVDLAPAQYLLAALVLAAIELTGPVLAERREGGTPWHSHHIAERYGLLAIITLGEILIGTVAALAAVIETQGWSVDVAVIAVGGVGLTFFLWWIYFMPPTGEVLHAEREKSFVWGYLHIAVYASIAAVGAGLHVAALALEHEAHISDVAVVWTLAVPVLAFFGLVSLLYAYLLGTDRLNWPSTLVKVVVVLASVGMAAAGISLAWCIAVIAVAPALSVLTLEAGLVGPRQDDAGRSARDAAPTSPR